MNAHLILGNAFALAIPCSTDRDGANFMVKKWRHHFQVLRILGWLNRSKRWLYRLLLLLLPDKLPARDLDRWWGRNQGTVSHCRQHHRVRMIVRQSRLAEFFRCICLEEQSTIC